MISSQSLRNLPEARRREQAVHPMNAVQSDGERARDPRPRPPRRHPLCPSPEQKMKMGSSMAMMMATTSVTYMARRASPRPRKVKEQATAPAMPAKPGEAIQMNCLAS